MDNIDDLLKNLDGEYKLDAGMLLAHLLQYSIRNKKYLEMTMRNQLEIKEMLRGNSFPAPEEIDDKLDHLLDELQKDIEQEYFDVISLISSGSKPDKE